jgi:predicted XRE-type DNA-binding protein
MDSNKIELSEMAQLLTTRLQDIASRKSQKEVAEEVGFVTPNVLSIMKKGATKLAIDRVPAMAKALDLELITVMLPALRQYFTEETIDAIRDAFTSAETDTERLILAIARKNMDTRQGLSHETREQLKSIFKTNTPKSKH